MEISRQKIDNILLLRLTGRLDASWCDPVRKAFAEAVRDGEHHIHFDMAGVDYISSTGLRILLAAFKELRAIKGHFAVVQPSTAVQTVLQLANLTSLIAESCALPEIEKGRSENSEHATHEIFPLPGAGLSLALIGHAGLLVGEPGEPYDFAFNERSFALGVGALGSGGASRFGEFLAVAGTAAFQPTDAATRPDFVVSQGDLKPAGQLLLGLAGEGDFSLLMRFEARSESRTLGLAELAETALRLSGASSVAITAITETSGLVGTTLRQSPAQADGADRFGFPKIRDWLAFSSERIFRDSTTLITGVAARADSPFLPLLRPLGPGLFGHFHAAAFPYAPMQKGRLELIPAVTALFDGEHLQAVLHLLTDSRNFTGTGESEFHRGALWIAPATQSK